MKNILVIMDKLLCGYLGLNKPETIPHLVKKKGIQLIVLNTESYKRQTQEIPISKINLKTINKENREKLGIAVGKAMATNLVVSFEEIVIKREKIYAR